MNSMTGYGKADLKTKNLGVSVELSSVNSRFLEYSLRFPKQLSFLEPQVKELIAAKVSRGKVTMSINYEDHGIGIDKLVVNKLLADEIYSQLQELKEKYGLGGEITLDDFLGFPDVFKVDKAENIEDKIWPCIKTAVNRALADMVAMRKQEGQNLKDDLLKRLRILANGIARIEKLCPDNITYHREKLSQKINGVLNGVPADANRLEEEIAYLAERCDITEECVRFGSHIKQFGATLRKAGSVGKRLNFLLQELNREINTIGAKSGNARISHEVVELKEEIEKMREQVQNIE